MSRGYLYIANSCELAYPMNLSVSNLDEYVGHEFEYIFSMPPDESEDLVKDLVQQFHACGAKTGNGEVDDKTFPFVVFTDDVKLKYFRNSYESFQKIATGITLEQFASDVCQLKCVIDDLYGDAVYYNGCFKSFDTFMRDIEPGTKVFFGDVFCIK